MWEYTNRQLKRRNSKLTHSCELMSIGHVLMEINVGLAEVSELWSAEGGLVPGTGRGGNSNPRSEFAVNRYQRGGQMREG
jgi:hypothetical protein